MVCTTGCRVAYIRTTKSVQSTKTSLYDFTDDKVLYPFAVQILTAKLVLGMTTVGADVPAINEFRVLGAL